MNEREIITQLALDYRLKEIGRSRVLHVIRAQFTADAGRDGESRVMHARSPQTPLDARRFSRRLTGRDEHHPG